MKLNRPPQGHSQNDAPQTAPAKLAVKAAEKTVDKNLRPAGSVQMQGSLDALDLATDPKHALYVPPHSVVRPPDRADHYRNTLISAVRVEENLLRSANGQYFILGDPIAAGVGGVIRGMRSPHQTVSQVYIVKEIAIDGPGNAPANAPAHGMYTQGRATFREADVADEVNIQAAIDHALTPHFVLRTHDRLFLAMPQMKIDVLEACETLANLPPVKLQAAMAAASEGAAARPGARWQTKVTTAPESMRVQAFMQEARYALAWRILEGASVGLEKLHGQGYVHGDVKMQNLLLRRDGEVHLADFGNARAGLRVHVASADQSMGTPGSMAPEQVVGATWDGAKADVWSLGIAVLGTLVGHNPFAAGYYAELAAAAHAAKGTTPPPPGAQVFVEEAERFARAWRDSLPEARARLASGAAGAAVPMGDEPVHILHAQLAAQAPALYPHLLGMLEPNPGRRMQTAQLRQAQAAIPAASRPSARALTALLGTVKSPVEQAIGNDARLSRPQASEPWLRRVPLRRANSTDTWHRPFTLPWREAPVSAATAFGMRSPAATPPGSPVPWQSSGRYMEAQMFLLGQDELFNQHLLDRPHVLAYFDGLRDWLEVHGDSPHKLAALLLE